MTIGISKITNQFEGKSITTLEYDGRPCWVAREIGAAMGYVDDGKRLVTRIRGEWSSELIVGKDYKLVQGKELAEFRAFFKGTDSVPLKSNRGFILLFESGIHLACLKTNKPIGRRLRRFIVDEVLPRYRPDGLVQSREAAKIGF